MGTSLAPLRSWFMVRDRRLLRRFTYWSLLIAPSPGRMYFDHTEEATRDLRAGEPARARGPPIVERATWRTQIDVRQPARD